MLQDYYVLLYNATALWLTIGLIWVVMGYGRKSKFADEVVYRQGFLQVQVMPGQYCRRR